jgi:hypothetical protein
MKASGFALLEQIRFLAGEAPRSDPPDPAGLFLLAAAFAMATIALLL